MKITPEEVYKRKLCIGCGICNSISEGINVDFIEDKNGRYKPITTISKNIKNFERICPGIFIENNKPLYGKDQLIWGHYRNIYKGYSCNKKIRFRSSSGGSLTAVAAYLLDKKIVDGVVHMGDGNLPLRYNLVLSKTIDELVECAGSKYIVSDYLKNIRKIFKENIGTFAFIGKPCDISAVKQLFKYDEILRGRIKIYLSFFCAGLPTYKAFNRIVEKFIIRKEDITEIKFRGNGWPGVFKIRTLQGKEYILSYEEAWGKFLGRDVHLRCKLCPDGVGKLADISFGDAWNIKDNAPDFTEKPGMNIIISRSDLGDEIINDAVDNNFIFTKQYSVEKLNIIQKYQYTRQLYLFGRLQGFKFLFKKLPIYKELGYLRLALKTNILMQFKVFLGMLKRTHHINRE